MDDNFRKFVIFALILMSLLILIIVFTIVITGTLKVTKPSITGQEMFGYVTVTILPRCNFNVGNGWTLFSLCAEPDNKSVDGILENTSYRYVMRWNTSRMEWDIYSPRSVENPFENFTTNESFFTLVYDVYTVPVPGTPNPDMNITMVQGWDAPSWPYEFDVNVTKYFNETLHRYMMKWSNPSQEFLIYSPRSVDNPFSEIYKAEGQMIYAYNNHTLEYNKTALQEP